MANILVIDDDIAICKLIETALTRDEHIVITKNSATEVTVNDFKCTDLIILDIMMPKVDGDAALEQIKKDEKLNNTKVIFLSAKNKETDIEKGILLRANAYMVKPFSIKKLVEQVNELISK